MCKDCSQFWRETLPEVDKCLKTFACIYIQWKLQGKEAIRILHIAADKLDTVKRNCNIAKLSGASVGIIGTGLAVTGIVLAPLTFGASTALLAAGISVGIVGGVTTAGGGITELAMSASHSKQMTEHLLHHQKLTEALSESLNDLYAQKDKLEKIIAQRACCDSMNMQVFAKNLLATSGVGAGTIAFAAQALCATKTGLDFSIAAKKVAFGHSALSMVVVTQSLSSVMLQGVLLGFSVIADVITIAITAADVAKGNKSERAQQFRQCAATLETKINNIDSEIGFLAVA